MAEEKQKKLRLMTFWLFGGVMIVFAAVTTYLYLFTANVWWAIASAMPVTLVVAVAAAIIYAVYYFLVYKKN